jgi:hypothetical protein
LRQGFDGPIEFSTGPFFVQEGHQALSKALQQAWQLALGTVTAAQCSSY